MVVTVQLVEDAARAVQAGHAPADLRRLAERLGIAFQPLHPGSCDRALMSFFGVEVADAAGAEQVIAALLHSPHVAAAYVKPPDAPPM